MINSSQLTGDLLPYRDRVQDLRQVRVDHATEGILFGGEKLLDVHRRHDHTVGRETLVEVFRR